jgi:hypothetical protein
LINDFFPWEKARHYYAFFHQNKLLMKRYAMILLAAALVRSLPLMAQNDQMVGPLLVEGSIKTHSSLTSLHASNQKASVHLNWYQNTARIRVGGNGIGSSNGLDIQTLGNRSLMRLLNNGNVGIGTSKPDSRLTVNGNIRAKELKLEAVNWPDYVFKPEYELLPLHKVKAQILSKGHLPGLKPAAHYEKDGIPMAEMTRILTEKVEELTLYLIQCEERIAPLEEKLIQVQSAEKPGAMTTYSIDSSLD